MQAVPGGDSFAREVIAIREPRRSDEPGSAVEAACASAWRSVMRTTPVWAETVVAACRGLGHLEDHQWKRAEMVWLFSAEGDVARGAVLAGASTATEVLRVMATSQRAGLDVMWARADALTRQIWPEVRELRRLAAGEVEGAHSGVVALLGSDDPENVAQGLELWRVDGVAQERMEAEEAEARGETS
jgi:hypothetical protein